MMRTERTVGCSGPVDQRHQRPGRITGKGGLIKRGIVKDVLSTESDARVKLHPKTPPVP
jgi:hypothetical protein